MPIVNGVGVSDETLTKQRHFTSIVETHLKLTCDGIFKNKYNWVQNNTYFYYDLNAGPGVYNDIIGSPIIFLNEARKYRHVKFYVSLFEVLPENAEMLESNIRSMNYPDNIDISIINKDSAQYLNKYAFSSGNQQFGMVYSDQNGKIPPFDTLSKFSEGKKSSRVDIVINLSATTIKRVSNQKYCTENRRLFDYLNIIDKNTWLIRKNHGRHQWTFLIGCNWKDFPEFKEIGFRKADSIAGKRILDELNYTSKEKKQIRITECRQLALSL